jgi:hypothetical protein
MRGNDHENTRAWPALVFVCNGSTAAAALPALLTQNGFFGRLIPDQ